MAEQERQQIVVSEVRPRYVHDCDRCHFLGHYFDEEEGHDTDLYFCQQAAIRIPTVIARFGEHGQYASGMSAAFGQDPALTEARKRAIAFGLIEPLTQKEQV